MTFSTVCTFFRTVNLVLSGLDAYKRHFRDGDAKSQRCAPQRAISEQVDLLLNAGGIRAREVCMNEKNQEQNSVCG